VHDKAAEPQIGRRRDPRTDAAILRVTLELIAERGVHGFRTQDVAKRAGVGKARSIDATG
jgi:AcrR family transcriptional regulator